LTPRRPAGVAASLLTRLLRPRRPKPAQARSLALTSPVRRVLAIKPHDQLGDFLIATPTLRALRERYPQARIVLVTREFLAPLARRVPLVDEAWVLPSMRGGRGLARWMEAVSAAAGFRPDLAWVLNSVSRSKTADTVAAASRAKVVIGRSRVGAGPLSAQAPGNPVEIALSETQDPIYDFDVPVGGRSTHQVDRVLDLVRWATGEPSSGSLVLEPSGSERREAQQALARALEEACGAGAQGAGESRPVVGLHPGAANALKCWPLESFVELGSALASSEEAPALAVFDSPRERGRAAAVCAGLAARGVSAAFLPVAGIDRFAALCSRLAVLVCNDSGVAHIASALGVPTISFHSLGDPREWGPRGRRAIAFHAPRDIAAIPASPAIEAVRILLRAPLQDSVGEGDC
jgi:ADP-heptose:LPS heptosyltransferase